MKKTSKKISLRKETIVQLTNLEAVQGGWNISTLTAITVGGTATTDVGHTANDTACQSKVSVKPAY